MVAPSALSIMVSGTEAPKINNQTGLVILSAAV